MHCKQLCYGSGWLAIEENSKKTRTISFRIPEYMIEEIEKEARIKMTSTNSLINKILLQYVKWDRYQERMRLYPIPQDSFQHILDHMDELRRGEVVDIIYNSIRDWTLISRKKFDLNNCLGVLEDYCRLVNIGVEENVSSGIRSYVVRHNLGYNVSSLVAELIKKIFWEIVKIQVDADITRTTVVAKLQSKVE